MSEKLFSYPTPAENPNCLCMQNGNGLAGAFFCQTGHMTECHSGMTCGVARCSHLPRYEEIDGEVTDYDIGPALPWNVRGVRTDGRELFEIKVFGPDEFTVRTIMEDWISETENLSKLEINYDIELEDRTAQIFGRNRDEN